MKLFVFGMLLLTSAAQAADYRCTDAEGHVAELTAGSSLSWNQLWDSAASGLDFIGQETAPFSPQRGYARYKLTDFYQTTDSAFILAVESPTAKTMKAVLYFDNDDHAEDETAFTCVRQ